jgi:hypothetical protein
VNNPLALFRAAAEAGTLADSGLLGADESDLEALVSYELWRAAFMRGSGALVAVDGRVVTAATVARSVRQRRMRVRTAKGGR